MYLYREKNQSVFMVVLGHRYNCAILEAWEKVLISDAHDLKQNHDGVSYMMSI